MLTQIPAPGTWMILHCGDCLTVRLAGPSMAGGDAWLRTNLGRAEIRREEILAYGEAGQAILNRDWHDVPMVAEEGGGWRVSLPLTEPGCFRAKAFVLSGDRSQAIWPKGGDLVVKVEPAETVAGNSIYTVFPRQFGSNKFAAETLDPHAREIKQLDQAGYTVIPPSGTFRDVVAELDFIMGDLGMRIIQLLPIHPVPSTYARMGRYGSPFASLDFYSVDPAVAEFDTAATPLQQFKELLTAVHARRGRVFIDLPANHTGWASHFHTHHPEWFVRDASGAFHSPGAWGVTWADLIALDYSNRELWLEMANVFLFWCRQGVDGFRCDAGYMVPLEVWTYITAKVRNEFPDCIFMLEGLGGPIAVMESLLTEGNLNWAYSELFQTESREAFDAYLPACNRISQAVGTLVHFAETHDNNRLAGVSGNHARMRTALCALFSHGGAYGITNGVEWLATEKVDVHGASALNWGHAPNQVEHINRLLAIVETHPSFRMGTPQRLIHKGGGQVLALLRGETGDREALLVLVNLDTSRPGGAVWENSDFPRGSGQSFYDLLGGGEIQAVNVGKKQLKIGLEAGEVVCLTPCREFLEALTAASACPRRDTERAADQRFRALALEAWQVFHGFSNVGDFDLLAAAECIAEKGIASYLAGLHGEGSLPCFTLWRFPEDARRQVMLPPGKMLLVSAPAHFSVRLTDSSRVLQGGFSLPQPDGRHMYLFRPLPESVSNRHCQVQLNVFLSAGTQQVAAEILALCPGEKAQPRMHVGKNLHKDASLYALSTNELGGYLQVRVPWGALDSQYDAFLAANLHPDFPVDRRVMVRRFRIWSVYRDFSQELSVVCQTGFDLENDGVPVWHFDVPVGQGLTVGVDIRARLMSRGNGMRLEILRKPAEERPHCLGDLEAVKFVIRPDVEDRSGHESTVAMAGPEHAFPAATRPEKKGFSFQPAADRVLKMTGEGCRFTSEPEWQYMVGQPFEANRGLAPHSDVFSPGYFSGEILGGEGLVLKAGVNGFPDEEDTCNAADASLAGVLMRAISQFIVKRDQFRTVIAGYPWFLDWGRDTLICLRGICAAGFHDECRDILLQFAQFEKDGTLPNMIRGDDDSNRDTSDAPLWLLTACADYIEMTGHSDILCVDLGGRTVLAALVSIAEGYRRGTPNGIQMDPASGLIFSPSHFTWMDTNHPAGTPREGYPIEIQALWIAGLEHLSTWTHDTAWRELADRARTSLTKYFARRGQAFLSDCLHGRPGTPAAQAAPDDHCRPNQLLAVTLGAVKDRHVQQGILSSCEALLVPGGIRSLADQPVGVPLPVYRDSQLLNNPDQPYWGRYEGDEDTRRKPAYHNGTAWSWQFPLYPEALFSVYGDAAGDTALALLMSSCELLNAGCIGHIPEIMDGDFPHCQRGCGAQAWGVTELFRVWKLLQRR